MESFVFHVTPLALTPAFFQRGRETGARRRS